MSPDRMPPPVSATPRPLAWTVVPGYFLVFLLLDWASYIRPLQDLNITPWNPQPALAVALLLSRRGLWWVVAASVLAADLVVRGMPADVFVAAAAAAALTFSYLAIATALRRTIGERAHLAGSRDVALFIAVVACGALLNGVVYVGVFAAGGSFVAPLWEALARYWVGDAVGMAVTLPIVLAVMDPQRRAHLVRTLAQAQWWLIVGVIGVLLWLLSRDGGPQRMDLSYLLLLPVIWGAARFGAAGALLCAAATQIGLIVTVQALQQQDQRVFELQLLMVALTATGLLLGVIVDQHQRAASELRRSLHLAAAGQMSAALAHELSQPLTALANYAQACELLARPGQSPDRQRQAQLVEVTHRIAQDAKRAGEVVRRLRDFFGSGSTQLASADPAALVHAALQAERRRAEAAGIALTIDTPPALPALWLDAVQIEVVLRNLVANAIEAALERGPGGRVHVRVTHDDASVTIEVIDSGPGIKAAHAMAIFELDAGSTKVSGMGVGLGICRAIVEAHGGRLWAEPGSQGHLCLTLPLDADARTAPEPADAP